MRRDTPITLTRGASYVLSKLINVKLLKQPGSSGMLIKCHEGSLLPMLKIKTLRQTCYVAFPKSHIAGEGQGQDLNPQSGSGVRALSQDVTLLVKEVLFSVFKSIMDGLIFVKRNSPKEEKKKNKNKALVTTKVPRH